MTQKEPDEAEDGGHARPPDKPPAIVNPDKTAVPLPSKRARPERTPTMADYLRVFTYATKLDLLIYTVAAVASLGAGITLPLMNIIFGQLTSSNILLERQALYIMALFLGRWGLNSINKFCFRMIGIRLSSAVRLHYLKALLAHPIQAIDSMPSGAPATAITTTANTLQLGISERLGTFLQFNGTIWSALIIAFIWSWDLTLVTSSLILYVVVVLSVVLPMILKGQLATLQADAEGTAVASESLEGIRLVMACGAQGRVLERYGKWVELAKDKAQAIAPVVGVQFGLMFFGVFGTFGLAFWYGTQRYISGAIDDAGVIIVVLMSVMMILTSLERVSTPLMAVSRAMVAACEFFAVIDTPAPPKGTLQPDIDEQDIILDGVTFEYPGRPGVKVLNGLSLVFAAGQNTALVGPSGSGKSTIVGLLQRWYSLREQQRFSTVVEAQPAEKKQKNAEGENVSEAEPEPEATGTNLSGTITIGNHNLEDFDITWWRSKIGLVQQEPFLFNDTIYGNVANGLLGTSMADEPEDRKKDMVFEACREAYAHDFIIKLPEGYDTPVGDGGIKLSGGQKQRIAIARSIISQPRIIILDEATSAIDAKSERIVQAALDRVTKGRTTITIAHRLSTIKKADRIIVLQKGEAVEEGTHQTLICRDGVYSALVKLQTLRLDLDAEEPAITEAAEHSDKQHDEDLTITLDEPIEQPQQPRGLLAAFFTLLYRQRTQWPSYAGIVLASAAVAAATPLQAWLFAKVIGVFVLEGENLSQESNFWGLMWFVLAAGVGISYIAQGWIGLCTQYAVSASYKSSYLADMLHQRVSFFDQEGNSHGSLSSRVGGDAKQLEELLGLNLGFLLSGIFTVVGCIAVALAFRWKLGLVATFVTMPVMLTAGWWKLRHEVQFDAMNSAVFTESSQFATEAVGAIRTVNALTMEDAIIDRYQRLLNGHVKAAMRKARWTAALFGFADSASLGCQALVFWYGGGLLARAIQGAEAASQALAVAPSAAQAGAAADRILCVHESAGMAAKGSGNEYDGAVHVELRDVSFRYPTRDLQVFNNLSLTIEKGQYAAFVGPSGCGKTTIISLLERFYDVQPGEGAILFNGTDINDRNLHHHQASLSLVSQEPMLFRGTIRENILFGVSNPESVSEDRLHAVCRDAFIHDFITSLPEGYNTDVGQKGVSMSGGQKQRIAIARALIRDPSLLLLDEATSALDSESEAIVLAAFEKSRRGRTVVAVAHRLATIQDADVIFVFNEGRVIERGSHNELVRQRGLYWGMCQSQALDQ